jgi:hypothetical protein
MHAFKHLQGLPTQTMLRKKATTPIASQKYKLSGIAISDTHLLLRPQQYNGASVMMIELINIAIGINANTKNN